MEKELKINNEFRDLIPSPLQDDLNNLEKDIIEYGCLDPISIWNDYIVDGHNRYDICLRNNIEFKTRQMEFNSEDDVKIWIIKYQINRRNLNTNDKNRLFFELMELENKKDSARPGSLAKELNISRGTEYRVNEILNKGTENIKSDVRQGKITTNAAYNQIRQFETPQVGRISNPSLPIDLMEDNLETPWKDNITNNNIQQKIKEFRNSEEGSKELPTPHYKKPEWTLQADLLKWNLITEIMDGQSSKMNGFSSVSSLLNNLIENYYNNNCKKSGINL